MVTAAKKTPATAKSTAAPAVAKVATKKTSLVDKTTAKPTPKVSEKKATPKTTVEKVVVNKTAQVKVTSTETKPVKKTTVKKVASSTIIDTPQEITTKAVSPEQRYQMIATIAYLKAESRGFIGGKDVEDWISAEFEVDAKLKAK